MNTVRWLMAKVIGFLFSQTIDHKNRKAAADREGGTFETGSAYQSAGFEGDYHAATNLLKQRMDKSFPDNFHARLGSQTNSMYDYGEDRAGAVDTASTAIAMALRNGATVSQAAEAGAASVGI
ncbi:hypothetical protein [Methylobacterium brachiatum]|jgi:hypothetical protein|uniref:Uncharacterized protein n=2 Tax=Methylobacterium brachiatum TaxID=269660 RepID=A0AAJ1TQ28_9HYPH|nr:hypothetical protein [Methylobacterium brachiatum]AYO84672.1 hypothetical protein EBB05_22110 [Methylobacterium brachiatum]MDQ0544936.1 hypothetical protein [Methylobacterium brachiatum]CAA2157153.1 hypothetical protein MBRA_02561 [Methylobacterium brachiatum]SFJ39933.1 hypothetical protein SAMN02799642_04306 [Methylobacterium brachiatum]